MSPTRDADASSAATRRPWQLPMGERSVTEALVDQWIRELGGRRDSDESDSASGSATESATESATGPRGDEPAGAGPYADGVSVVISYRRGDDLAGCLDSIRSQTLSVDSFEVIVVVEGAPGELDRVLSESAEQPMTLRAVELSGIGVFCHRDIGVAAARRPFIAFVDARDRISPGYLESLLKHADDETILLAPVVPVAGGDPPTVAEALMSSAGTLVPAALAKQVERDATPRSAHDVVFFMAMLADHRCGLRETLVADGEATYHRAAGSAAEPSDPPDFESDVVVRLEVIAQLDALSHDCDPATLDLLCRQVDAQVDVLNAYLRQNPAAHPRVVQLLDEYELENFPYERLNAGMARALAVAYCFAPYNDSSAVVMAKRVRDRADIVDVVFNSMDKNRERDPSLRRICGPYVENELAIDSPTYFSNWAAIEAFCAEGLARISALERAKGTYDRLYSRVMWPASHFLAAAYKLRNPTVAWTAEFSDPAARDVAGAERRAPISPGPLLDMVQSELKRKDIPLLGSRNCLDWCEYLAYACADSIVFTNENQRDYMLSYCPIAEVADMAREKSVISPHPTLAPAFYSMVQHPYVLDQSVVNLAYFGNFYATRGLGDVLQALARLEPDVRARLRLHVFTSKPADLQGHIDDLQIGDIVRSNGYVRFLAFLNLATKFDCLIVNDALTAVSHERNPYLPSKWSDYTGTGRPVWGLVEAGSPLSTRPLTFASPVGDVDAAAGVLHELARRRGSPLS
ncbi:glycosyltransferase [Actinopolymorpha sp. B9G3]|uniref:glycosyltransferase n=1 Tax=Actinopolymorpha sp. B9G3 TaxID=3158970 RepID=UPI0032D991AB